MSSSPLFRRAKRRLTEATVPGHARSMHRALGSLIVGALAVAGLAPLQSQAPVPDWTQWRGPNRDGHSAETGLLQEWPANGPPLLWRTTGAGTGYSSFSSSNGRLFTLGARA